MALPRGADVIMSVIGAITSGQGLSNSYTALSAKVQLGLPYADAKKQRAILGYGQFLTVAVNLMIIAFVLFMAIRRINKLKKAEEAKPAAPPEIPADVKLLGEMRDLLARRSA